MYALVCIEDGEVTDVLCSEDHEVLEDSYHEFTERYWSESNPVILTGAYTGTTIKEVEYV